MYFIKNSRIVRIGNALSFLFYKVTTGGSADLHLQSAIEKLLKRLTVARPMTISIDTEMFYEKGLSKKGKRKILRVLQAQFNNIVKNGNASEVYVSLRRTRQRAYLVIHDNGQGSDATRKRNGLFITDIVEYAEMNHGQATIVSDDQPHARREDKRLPGEPAVS